MRLHKTPLQINSKELSFTKYRPGKSYFEIFSKQPGVVNMAYSGIYFVTGFQKKLHNS